MDGSERRQSIERGRGLTRRLVQFQVALAMLGAAAAIGAGERGSLKLLRLVLSVVFIVAIYSGSRGAAVVAGWLALLGAVLALGAGVAWFSVSVVLALAFVALSTVACVVALQFVFSPDVKTFQEFLRTGSVEEPDLAEVFERQVRVDEEREQDRQLLAEVRREEAAEFDAQRERSRVHAEEAEAARIASFERQGLGPWQPRERLLVVAAGFLAAISVGQWLVALQVSGSQLLREPASVTPLAALIAFVLVALGMTYGRFVALGLTLGLLALGGLKLLQARTGAFAPWIPSFAVGHLLLLAVAGVGLVGGVARDAARTSTRDQAARSMFGLLIGAMVAVVCGRPPLLSCGAAPYADAGQLSSCSRLQGASCADTPGCHATPGSCRPSCETEGGSQTCQYPCVPQDGACVFPTCQMNGSRCGTTEECGLSSSGACVNLCEAAPDQDSCSVVAPGAFCRWVACVGRRTKSCADYAYDECPERGYCSKSVY